MPSGETQTPLVFQATTRHVTHIMRTTPLTLPPNSPNTPSHSLTHNYADDWINVTSPDPDLANSIHSQQLTTITSMGPILSVDKTNPPSHQQIAQGLLIDTTDLTISVPQQKHLKLAIRLHTLAHHMKSTTHLSPPQPPLFDTAPFLPSPSHFLASPRPP